MVSPTNSVAPTTWNRTVLSSAKIAIFSRPPAPSYTMPPSHPTAVYLINNLPTKTLLMQSPYEKLYQQPPSLLHLKIFGCLCYPWTAYTRTNKLDPKSSPCIFLGYSSDHKSFRCFDPLTSKLIILRHVRFHKHEFPMAKQPTITPLPQISTIHNPLSPLFTPTFYPPPPTFYPPPSTSTSSPNRPPTLTPTPLPTPPRKTATYIQCQRRRPHPTTLPLSTLPPLLPLLEPSSPPPQATYPTSTHPMTTRSQTATPTTPTTSLNLSLTTFDLLTYQQASSNPH